MQYLTDKQSIERQDYGKDNERVCPVKKKYLGA
jgi:hypothetical protein